MAKLDLSGIDILQVMQTDGILLRRTATSHGGEYHSACPFCGGNDRFTVWPHHEDGKGRYWCRKCEAHGDALDFVMLCHNMTREEALNHIKATPKPAPRRAFEPKKRPVKATAEWADKKWGKLTAEYPYLDAEGALAYTIQRREIWVDGKRTAKNFAPLLPDNMTYGLNGQQRYLYHLPEVLEARETGETIFIVEGEKCVEVMRAKALIATTSAGGAKGWTKFRDCYLEHLRGANVVLLPDNDSEGAAYMEAIANDLRGIAVQTRIINLPRLNPKEDIYDWFAAGNRVADLQLLVRDTPDWSPTIEQPTDQRWKLLTTAQLLQYPPITYLIDGEIPVNGLSVMFGASGVGKSFLALDYSLTVAQTQPVVYMIGEGLGGYPDRLRAWCAHNHKTPPAKLYWLDNAIPLMSESDVSSLTTQLKALSPALIVIDTLARAMLGGDENSARDMGQMIASCQQIQRALGAAVLLVHHTDKAGRGERGSSALRGAADSMIEVTDEDGLMIISCSKSKDRESFPTRYMRRLPVMIAEGRQSIALVSSERVITSIGSLSPTERQILEILVMEVFAVAGAKARDIKEQCRFNQSSVHRTLSRLMRRGYVRQDKHGDPYWIEEAGKRAIGSIDTDSQLSGESPESHES